MVHIQTGPSTFRGDATKHRIGYNIGRIGHIGVQIMLLLDITQYKVEKCKKVRVSVS